MSGTSRPMAIRTTTEQSSRPTASRTTSSGPENYACPFAKRDPIKYSHFNPDASGDQEFRSCSTGLMRNISRLKQHLSRTHRDEMTEEQQRLVMERISGDHAQGWYNIYHILFPDQPLPATPYAEYVTGEHMRRLLKHIASRLPLMLYQIASATERPGAPVAPLQANTRFPVTPQILLSALQRCSQDFGQTESLSHVFQTKPASADVISSSRTAVRAPRRPTQDPRMAQSMGTFPAGSSPDEEMSGMSSSEEFEEELALRTIEDHDAHSPQMRSNPNYSPVFSSYTAYQVQSPLVYDNANRFTAQRTRTRQV